MTPDFLKSLEGKCTGLAEEGEKITLKLIPLGELWCFTTDSKALCALCLYQNLKKSIMI